MSGATPGGGGQATGGRTPGRSSGESGQIIANIPGSGGGGGSGLAHLLTSTGTVFTAFFSGPGKPMAAPFGEDGGLNTSLSSDGGGGFGAASSARGSGAASATAASQAPDRAAASGAADESADGIPLASAAISATSTGTSRSRVSFPNSPVTGRKIVSR